MLKDLREERKSATAKAHRVELPRRRYMYSSKLQLIFFRLFARNATAGKYERRLLRPIAVPLFEMCERAFFFFGFWIGGWIRVGGPNLFGGRYLDPISGAQEDRFVEGVSIVWSSILPCVTGWGEGAASVEDFGNNGGER